MKIEIKRNRLVTVVVASLVAAVSMLLFVACNERHLTDIEYYRIEREMRHQEWKNRTEIELNAMLASGNVTGHWGFSESGAITGCLYIVDNKKEPK